MAHRHPEELFIALLRSAYGNACHGLVQRRPAIAPSKLPTAARGLTYLALSRTRPLRPAQVQRLSASNERRRGYAAVPPSQQKQTQKKHQPPPQPPPQPKQRIAVLGGGITGLTAAHYLARNAPNAHITLYEASDRLGGWIEGVPTNLDTVEGHDGEVLMQRGPRMLRSGATSHKYDDLVLYDVLANLKIQDKLIYPKGVAGLRYIYYPDHLVQLPKEEVSWDNISKTIRSYFTEPMWTGMFNAAAGWARAFTRSTDVVEQRRRDIKDIRTAFDDDESVAAFLGRIFGDTKSPVIDNIISGMLHGIYGGDIHKLSAKHTIFEKFWLQDRIPLHNGGAWIYKRDGDLQADILDGPNRIAIIEMAEKAVSENLLAFSDGLMTLVDSLSMDLARSKNVTVKTGTPVSAVEQKGNRVVVTGGDGGSDVYHRVLSTLYSGDLAQIARPENSLPSLADIKAVSIMVVNLWYPNADLLQDNPGFGYLIPQSVPPEENPECALGVLFDSDIETRNEVKGTKLTVMLGGHYWSDWSMLPDEEMAVEMARAIVERHLGIPQSEPFKAGAKMCKDCLPQHTVGHVERLRKAHYELSAAFQGKVMVAGPSYTSVGVIPAMRAGYDAAMRIAKGHGQPWSTRQNYEASLWDWHDETVKRAEELGVTMGKPIDHVGTTGLEWATEKQFAQMGEMIAHNLMFKRWTQESWRFVDKKGNWIVDPKQLFKLPGKMHANRPSKEPSKEDTK
ncbi:oxygen-dependent protoporphyrinogen oxidase [Pestalotiopsis sp. 9143b]|nr:oxygen-dependent protoporphyrinogen oxidase [Pestalotiopsis sp. 9143b]